MRKIKMRVALIGHVGGRKEQIRLRRIDRALIKGLHVLSDKVEPDHFPLVQLYRRVSERLAHQLLRPRTFDEDRCSDREALKKVVWRVARRGRDPLRGAIANGRWSAIGEFEVLYTSLEADGALAEVGHRLSLEPVWPSASP